MTPVFQNLLILDKPFIRRDHSSLKRYICRIIAVAFSYINSGVDVYAARDSLYLCIPRLVREHEKEIATIKTAPIFFIDNLDNLILKQSLN